MPMAPAPHALPQSGGTGISVVTEVANLDAGSVRFDLYLPADEQPAPLVIVAHGFNRNRTNMVGWGRKLAEEGFAAAVPTLPAWADHSRNGRAINQLFAHLHSDSRHGACFDSSRIGVVGFSAGGLSSLLAAADNPSVKIWVGLDPVDRHNLGTSAAPRLKARAVVLRAEPSRWNAHGNAQEIEKALPDGWIGVLVPQSIHLDPEWPTEWRAELFIGKVSDQRRMVFVQETLSALKRELIAPPAGS